LDLADRINNDTFENLLAIKRIKDHFYTKIKHRVWMTCLLMENLIKNCGMNFHMEWARKENQKVLLKLLKKRRGK